MRKILAGVVVAIVLGAIAVYVGLPRYLQMRVEHEVDAAFDAVRASGGSASHGAVQFDFASRTVTIADIDFKSAGDLGVGVKVGRLIATNVDQHDAKHFTADHIELADTELQLAGVMPAGMQASYKMPKVVVDRYSGPIEPPSKPVAPSPLDGLRLELQYFSTINAQSVLVPALTASVVMSGNTPPASIDYVYSNIAMREIHGGHVGEVSADQVTFSGFNLPDFGGATGEANKLSMRDIDVAPFIAALGPPGAAVDDYVHAYGRVSVDSMTMKFGKGGEMHFGAMSIDEFALRPAKLKLGDLLSMKNLLPAPGQQPSPEQTRAFLEQAASIYEAIRMNNFAMRDISATVTPDATFKIGAIRIAKLEDGKFAEMALEGFDGQTAAKEPVQIGRFALKGIDAAKFMRSVAQFSPGQQPSADQTIGMLAFLEGIEVSALVAPTKTGGKPARVDAFNLSWGQFVGPLPTQAKLTGKVAIPVEPGATEPFLGQLANAGITTMTGTFDFGLNWTEPNQTLAMAPFAVDIGSVGAVSATWSVNHMPRDAFTVDPLKLAVAATVLEAGPLQITLRDAGGVDLAVSDFAKSQGMAADAARTQLAALVRTQADTLSASNPDFPAVGDAIVEFLNNRGATLTLKVSPKAHVNLMQAADLAKTDPMSLLPQFKFEASVSK